MKDIVILGSNFAGLTAALKLGTKLKRKKGYKITIISPTHDFLYVPSLIWVPFGRREVKDIRFDIRPLLKKKGIEFIQEAATSVDPDKNIIKLPTGEITYDYLVVATGVSMNFDVIDGLQPEKNQIQNIVLPQHAKKTQHAFEDLVKDPGPVVIGATQNASCMGAAYEYLFNMDKELRRKKVRDKVTLYWITPEPYLGNFGIDGMPGGEAMLKMFMKLYNIKWIIDASIAKIENKEIHLKDGTILPYKMAMLMPPFEGATVMKNSPKLVDAKGFVETKPSYQHLHYENVFAAGLAVKVAPPFKIEKTPFGVPKTGYPSDITGKIVARNILRLTEGKKKLIEKDWGKIPALCVMDAGHKEVYLFANHLFKPRQFAIIMPNVFNDWGKVLLEKYFLWKNRHGYVWLP